MVICAYDDKETDQLFINDKIFPHDDDVLVYAALISQCRAVLSNTKH